MLDRCLKNMALSSMLLLGSLATAHAAEPPDASGSAYVKRCRFVDSSFYGGFWYVPGTDTCMRLGGYIWAEGYYSTYTDEPLKTDDSYSIATYGLQLDTRTDTEYGLLRSYIDIRIQYRTAAEWGVPLETDDTMQANPWNVYIQFGGFTFGYIQSMFAFYANQNVYGTDPATIGDGTHLRVGAYTWDLPQGWTATVSLEQADARDEGVNPANAYSTDTLTSISEMPDIVGVLGQSGNWGQLQLSAALHRETAVLGGDTLISGGASGSDVGSFWGYAMQAGVMFNLPQIASGDTLYLQTAYVDGAVSYLGLVNASGDFSPPDAFLNTDGSFSKVSGWNATFQFLHNFSSTWNATIFGGYAAFDLNNLEAEATLGASGGVNYNLGGNITWQPNAAFSLTLQYGYNMYQAKDYVNTGKGLPTARQEASQLLLMAQMLF